MWQMRKIAGLVLAALLLTGCAERGTVQTHHMENGDTCYTAHSSNGNMRGIDCTKE